MMIVFDLRLIGINIFETIASFDGYGYLVVNKFGIVFGLTLNESSLFVFVVLLLG